MRKYAYGLRIRKNNMETRTSGKAVASLVCGILSLLIPFLGFVLGVLGIVFGVLSRKEIQRSEKSLKGKGMAIAGFVCGIIGVAWTVIIFIILGIIGRSFEAEFLDSLMTA